MSLRNPHNPQWWFAFIKFDNFFKRNNYEVDGCNYKYISKMDLGFNHQYWDYTIELFLVVVRDIY